MPNSCWPCCVRGCIADLIADCGLRIAGLVIRNPQSAIGGAPMADTDKANILVVDDLPEKLLVLETILEGLGQNLVFVRSGEEALRQILDKEFAVILLDV